MHGAPPSEPRHTACAPFGAVRRCGLWICDARTETPRAGNSASAENCVNLSSLVDSVSLLPTTKVALMAEAALAALQAAARRGVPPSGLGSLHTPCSSSFHSFRPPRGLQSCPCSQTLFFLRPALELDTECKNLGKKGISSPPALSRARRAINRKPGIVSTATTAALRPCGAHPLTI